MHAITRRAAVLGAVGAAATLAIPVPRARAATPSAIIWTHAHQDDETFWAVSIIKHLQAGQDVHVLCATDGSGAGVLASLNGTAVCSWCAYTHDPATRGYAPLDAAAVSAARYLELQASLDAMGAGLPGKLIAHRAGRVDGTLTQAQAQADILALADEIAPGAPVRLKGHSPYAQLEGHPDHRAVGGAIQALLVADPGRFADGGNGARYYVQPPNWNNTPPSGVTLSWDTTTDATIIGRAWGSAYAYRSWAPREGHFAAGYHSAASFFAAYTTPKARYHA